VNQGLILVCSGLAITGLGLLTLKASPVYWGDLLKRRALILALGVLLLFGALGFNDAVRLSRGRPPSAVPTLDDVQIGDSISDIFKKKGEADFDCTAGNLRYFVFLPNGVFGDELRVEVSDGHVVALEERNLKSYSKFKIADKIKLSEILRRWGKPDNAAYDPSQIDRAERYYLFKMSNLVLIGESEKIVGVRQVKDESKFLPAFNPALPKVACHV
jgi:hypothetical protein